MKKCLNRDIIKYIAVFAMLLDHIAWYFLEFASPLAQIFHTVGRITAPTMCFFLAQGFEYTRSRKKYAFRLAAFAVLAQIPWIFLHDIKWYEANYNMLFTLLICLLILWAYEYIDNFFLKFLSIAALFACSFACDWFFLAPIFTLVFYFTRNNEKRMYISFCAAGAFSFVITFLLKLMSEEQPSDALLSSLYMLGVFLCIPLLMMYNGQKGRFKASKWVFYIFYPAHLAVIAVICFLIK